MIDILQFLPPHTRKSPSGFFTFNCPACIHNGETQDKRKRAGIILEDESWGFSCFNCGFKTRFVNGQQLSLKSKKLLQWLGVDETTIKKINFDSLKNKKIYDITISRTAEADKSIRRNIHFETAELPGDSRKILLEDTWAIEYLANRGLDYRNYPYKITPNESGRKRRRIIIPFFYAGEIVGWSSRFLDSYKPKYKNEQQQPGYVFGLDHQKDKWDFVIVTEGIFNAIAIDGVALLHNTMNQSQVSFLRRQGKEIIVVPDMDKPGLGILPIALSHGFSISIPDWDISVNDINDAVVKYGKIGTLLSIINNKTSNKIKAKLAITALRKKLKIND